MFSRLKNWISSIFSKRDDILVADDLAIYKLKDRLIFHYDNGAEVVSCDPMVLYKKLIAVGPDLSTDMKIAKSPSKDAVKYHTKMVEKIRVIFDIKPFREGGLTEPESVDLLDDFLIFCEALKKNSRQPSTSVTETSASTVPPSKQESTTGSTPNGQSTQNHLDSGSTENGPTTTKQPQSPSVPE